MTETNITVSNPQRKFKGLEKATVLLLAMRKENASRLLAHFGEEEIRAIAQSAPDLGSVPQTALDNIAGEFIAELGLGGGLHVSAEQVQELLDDILPPEQVRQIMSDVHSRINEAVWPRLVELPAQAIAQFLNKEHPQAISFVLSKVTTSLSAEVLTLLPPILRNEVMRRMLTNKLVTQQAQRLLEQVLRDELLLKFARASGEDAHARIAKIINKLGRREMEEVLESLGATRPKAAEIIRGLLFTFNDIVKLTQKTRTVLFENVEAERLIPALSGADPGLKELILSSVPSRTRRAIEQDLALTPPLSDKEIEKAQREIADIALQLADQGVINLTVAGTEE
ncbi:MAG: flagellar motor switch protein FliG [Rhodomicrobium sp.]